MQARAIMTSDLDTVRTGGVEAVLGPGGSAQAVSAVAYSPPGGMLLATGGVDGIVRLYDMPQHKLVATRPNGHKPGAVNSLAFAPNGIILATGSSDGKVRLFTVSQDKLALVRTARANTPSKSRQREPVQWRVRLGRQQRRVRAVRFDACRG